jgi:hypothetical protein
LCSDFKDQSIVAADITEQQWLQNSDPKFSGHDWKNELNHGRDDLMRNIDAALAVHKV